MVAPSQYGPPFDAVGVAGIALTTTFVVPADEVQPLTVMVTEYVPASAAVADARVGLCCVRGWGTIEWRESRAVQSTSTLRNSGREWRARRSRLRNTDRRSTPWASRAWR